VLDVWVLLKLIPILLSVHLHGLWSTLRVHVHYLDWVVALMWCTMLLYRMMILGMMLALHVVLSLLLENLLIRVDQSTPTTSVLLGIELSTSVLMRVHTHLWNHLMPLFKVSALMGLIGLECHVRWRWWCVAVRLMLLLRIKTAY
jgi:hypothetical protein